MVFFAATLVIFFCTWAFVVGLHAAKSTKRRLYCISGVCLSLVLLRALLRYFPEWEFAVPPNDFYRFVRFWWHFPFAFVLLGVGVVKMSTRRARIGVGVLTFLVSLLVLRGLIGTVANQPVHLTGSPNENGICLQSSNYSCGPAVVATILAKHGVFVSEAEAAKLCGTIPSLGTDEFNLRQGLAQKLPKEFIVEIIGADWETLRRVPKPAAAIIKYSFLIDHWVAVLDLEHDEVLLADPLSGKMHMSREKFTKVWRNVLVVARETKSPCP
jgi:hypothetical protein